MHFYYTWEASPPLHFLQIEGSGPPFLEQAYWHPFSNSIWSFHVSVLHFGNLHAISNFLIIIIFLG